MDRFIVEKKIGEKFKVAVNLSNGLEANLILFSDQDYFHPTKRISFPLSIAGMYGEGGHALIIKVRDSQGEDLALRLFPINSANKEDAAIQSRLAQFALAPDLFYVGQTSIPGISYSIMEPITATLSSILKEGGFDENGIMIALKCLLDKKFLLGFTHGDMHAENIVILKDGVTLGVIDFDWSFFISDPKFAFLNILDFIPLLGGICMQNRSLSARLRNYYQATFRISIDCAKFVLSKKEGVQYMGLFSYLKNFWLSDRLGEISAKFMQVFPTIVLPEIVD